jgi:hypothetical protein
MTGPVLDMNPGGEMRKLLKKDPKKMTQREKDKAKAAVVEMMRDAQERVRVLKEMDPFWFYEPAGRTPTEEGSALLRKYLKAEDIPETFDSALDAHMSKAGIVGVLGGNQSSKSTTGCINDLIKTTGQMPESLKGLADHRLPKKEFNRARVVCADYTYGILNHNLPALKKWVPKQYLIDGKWEKSWSDKRNTLTLVDPKKRAPCGTIEFMSNQADVVTFQGPPLDGAF